MVVLLAYCLHTSYPWTSRCLLKICVVLSGVILDAGVLHNTPTLAECGNHFHSCGIGRLRILGLLEHLTNAQAADLPKGACRGGEDEVRVREAVV